MLISGMYLQVSPRLGQRRVTRLLHSNHCPVSQRSRSSLVKYPFCVSVFDKDRSGFASSSEIKTVMANLGVHFTDEEIQEMMIEV